MTRPPHGSHVCDRGPCHAAVDAPDTLKCQFELGWQRTVARSPSTKCLGAEKRRVASPLHAPRGPQAPFARLKRVAYHKHALKDPHGGVPPCRSMSWPKMRQQSRAVIADEQAGEAVTKSHRKKCRMGGWTCSWLAALRVTVAPRCEHVESRDKHKGFVMYRYLG